MPPVCVEAERNIKNAVENDEMGEKKRLCRNFFTLYESKVVRTGFKRLNDEQDENPTTNNTVCF